MGEAFNQLPFPGGLFAQPASYLLRMERVLDARNSAEEAKTNTEDQKRKAQERVAARFDATN